MTPDPTPPTPALDRAELRRMCEAASPGPWRACWYGPNEPAMLERVRIESPEDEGALIADFFTGMSESPKQRENADFVAAARTALPALLDALDAAEADGTRLEAYRDRLEALLSDIVGEMGGSLPAPIPPEYVREVAFDAIHKIEDERDALRAEVETWRGRVNRLDAILGGATYIEDATRDIAIYRGNRTQWSAAHGKREIGHAKYLTWSAAWSAAEAAQASAERSGEGAK